MEELKKKLKLEIQELLGNGFDLLCDEVEKQGEEVPGRKKDEKRKRTNLHMDYQRWYTKSLRVVQQLLPDRYEEFCAQYKLDKRKEITFLNYTIADYLIGLRITKWEKDVFNTLAAFSSKFQLQITILQSALERIDSILADVEGVIRAELFKGELHAAEDLLGKKHYRASGTLAGVTLEFHLAKVSVSHGVTIRKKLPSISDYNEELKKEKIIDVPTWRLIQRLGDIRNLCVHAKEREPKPDEIEDIINGVNKIVSSVF